MLELLRLEKGASAIVHELLSIPPAGWKAKVAAKKAQYLSGNYKTPAFGIIESRSSLQQAIFISMEGDLAQSFVITRTGAFDHQLFDASCNVCSMHSPTIIRHEITFAAGLEQAFQAAWSISRLGRFTEASQIYPGKSESSKFIAMIRYPA